MIQVEQTTKGKLHTDAGVWIEQLLTTAPRAEGEGTPGMGAGAAPGAPAMGAMDPMAAARFRERYGARYGLEGRGGMPGRGPGPGPSAADQSSATEADGAAPGATPARRKAKGDANEIATITMTFRAVSLKNSSGQADADKGIAYAVLQELQNSPFFDPDPQETHTTSEVVNDEQNGTFTFSIVARLKHPLKL
jgi:hypothetical protein